MREKSKGQREKGKGRPCRPLQSFLKMFTWLCRVLAVACGISIFIVACISLEATGCGRKDPSVGITQTEALLPSPITC